MGAQSRGRESEVEELRKARAFKLCLERFIGLRPEELGKGGKEQDGEDLLWRRKCGEITSVRKA